jgi:acetyltransferase
LAGLEMAELAPGTTSELEQMLPPAAGIGNPIDIMGTAGPERYGQVVEIIGRDPSVDGMVVILSPQAMTQPLETARVITERVPDGKPLMPVFMGGGPDMEGSAEMLEQHSLPAFTSPERAVAALQAMWSYRTWRERPVRIVTRFPVYRRRAQRIVDRQIRVSRRWIGEVRSKELLRAYGFAVPEGREALTADEAVDAAEHVGYPVALKVVSPDILHKSDIGGVRLNLTNASEVRDAYDLMMLHVQRRMPAARVEGAYVEQMVPSGYRVIIGMTRDPQFGPMLTFGLGGTFIESMKDAAFQLAPITRDEALQMMSATRPYAMMQATGGSDMDLDAVAAGLQRISQLATDIQEIVELDINPLIVGESGTEPVVADVRIALAQDENP